MLKTILLDIRPTGKLFWTNVRHNYDSSVNSQNVRLLAQAPASLHDAPKLFCFIYPFWISDKNVDEGILFTRKKDRFDR